MSLGINLSYLYFYHFSFWFLGKKKYMSKYVLYFELIKTLQRLFNHWCCSLKSRLSYDNPWLHLGVRPHLGIITVQFKHLPSSPLPLIYLSINSTFNRPAVDGNISLFVPERVTLSNTDHFLDQIQAGNAFCDGMFNLQGQELSVSR